MAKDPLAADIVVGARMRVRRKELGMSQGALGEKLGITFQQVQKYEKGTNRVGASRLDALARVLEVPITYFFEAPDEQTSLSSVRAMAQPGAQELLAAFSKISDPALRKAVLTLARNLAAVENPAEQQGDAAASITR